MPLCNNFGQVERELEIARSVKARYRQHMHHLNAVQPSRISKAGASDQQLNKVEISMKELNEGGEGACESESSSSGISISIGNSQSSNDTVDNMLYDGAEETTNIAHMECERWNMVRHLRLGLGVCDADVCDV